MNSTKIANIVSVVFAATIAISQPAMGQSKQRTASQAVAMYYIDEVKRSPDNPMAFDAKSRSNMLDGRYSELQSELDSGKIGLVEHAARALSIAKIYFPTDKSFTDLRQYKLDISIQHENGEISKDELDALWDMKKREFSAIQDNRKRDSELANQASEQQRNSAAIGNTLNAISRGLNNASRSIQQSVPITCQTIANVTTCR